MSSSSFFLSWTAAPLVIASVTQVSTCARKTNAPAWPSADCADAICKRTSTQYQVPASIMRATPSTWPAMRCSRAITFLFQLGIHHRVHHLSMPSGGIRSM